MQTIVRLFCDMAFKAFAALYLCLCANSAHSESPVGTAHVLVIGGASHTQAGFSDPRIDRFYLSTAANSAEKLALALTAAGVRNTKFITWSRSSDSEYKQELGFNLAGCSCNFLMQVSFSKNIVANPPSLFFDYQLLYLAKSVSDRPGMEMVLTQRRYSRKFEVPVSDLELISRNSEVFANEVVADMVKLDAFSTAKKR